MSLDPKRANQPPRKLIPPGLKAGRCFAIIDLGTQQQVFKGVAKEPAPEVMLCFEFTNFMLKFDENQPPVPSTIMQKYLFSNGQKAKLPKVLQSWRNLPKAPEQLDLTPYCGQYAYINITHSEDGQYANISDSGRGINALPQDVQRPKPHYEKIYFDLDKFTWEAFNKLPKYPKELIKKSKEWASIIKNNPEPVSGNQQEQAMDEGWPEENNIHTGDSDGTAF